MHRHLLIALCIVLATAATLITANQQKQTFFMCGMSGSSGGVPITSQLRDKGHVQHERRYMMWKYAQHQLDLATEANFSVADVKANVEKFVDDWADKVPRWDGLDNMIRSLCSGLKQATGGRTIMPLLEVFEGTTSGLPEVVDSRVENGATAAQKKTLYADPCVMGKENYLGHIYRWVRALTRRYVPVVEASCRVGGGNDTRPLIFQLENELNEAGLSIVYGQRSWCLEFFDFSFLTETLNVLKSAVRDEEQRMNHQFPKVQVTTNLHTDVPKSFHEMTHLPGYYLDAAKAWAPLLDMVALDAYPNMYIATPIRADVVGERIGKVRQITTKPVFIMETGYPVNDPKFPANFSALEFNQSNQAAYAAGVVDSVATNGGSGLFFFEATESAGMKPPAGGYTAADASLFAEARTFLTQQNMTQLIDWALKPGNLNELVTRAPFYLTRADKQKGWAIFNDDDSPKPAFGAIAARFAKYCN